MSEARALAWSWWSALGILALLALGAHVAFAWAFTPEVFAGGLTEPDGYMRLVRVRRLWETGAWFDGTIPRSNAPFGETLHWTRPFDVLLLVGAVPLSLLMPFDTALHAWAVAVTPILFVATGLALVWAAAPWVSGPLRPVVMLALLAQPAVMSYALPGRADHHAFVFLGFALAVGSLGRAVASGRDRGAERGVGLAVAFLLWLTVESLALVGGLLIALAVLWVAHGGDLARRAGSILAMGTAGVALAIGIERGPAGFGAVEYDRVSVAHLFFLGCAAAAWGAIDWASGRGRVGRAPIARAGAVAAAGVAAAILLAIVLPDFYRGPWAGLTAAQQEYWTTVITELQPVVPFGDRLGVFVAYLGLAFVGVPFAGWRIVRERDPSARAAWAVVGVLFVVYLPLAMSSLRFTPFPELLFALTVVAVLDQVRQRIGGRMGRVPRLLVLIGLTLAMLLGPLVIGGTLVPEPDASVALARPCEVSELAGVLGGEPKTVVAHQDLGPELLYRTPHRVIATTYHRNVEAVQTTHELLTSDDADFSRRVLEQRGADLILLCPDRWGGYFASRTPSGRETLYARLVGGRPPGWLRPVRLAAAGAEGFLLFEVLRSGE